MQPTWDIEVALHCGAGLAARVALIDKEPNPANGRLFVDWVLEPEDIAEFIPVSLEVLRVRRAGQSRLTGV